MNLFPFHLRKRKWNEEGDNRIARCAARTCTCQTFHDPPLQFDSKDNIPLAQKNNNNYAFFSSILTISIYHLIMEGKQVAVAGFSFGFRKVLDKSRKIIHYATTSNFESKTTPQLPHPTMAPLIHWATAHKQ